MAARKSHEGRRRARRRPWRRRLLLATGLTVAVAGGWFAWPFWRLSAQFGARADAVPSRLYGRGLRLVAGEAVDRGELLEELAATGYRRIRSGAPQTGEYRLAEDFLEVGLRPFPVARGRAAAARLRAALSGRRVERIELGGRRVEAAGLEPPLLASYYGPDHEERWPAAIGELPDHLLEAVLAAEDDSFFRHPGLSASGILRAAWVNLKGGGVVQGGSTLTQQLVKNRYLTHERTWLRKGREAVLALLIEVRHGKREILEAYLNEIYWGKSGPVNVMGVGAAARAYFGRPPAELTLAESALLAGMIRSPGHYSPLASVERASERRDWVLGRMADLGWISAEQAQAARALPVERPARSPFVRQAPYFADAAAAEAARRFGAPALAGAGYTLLTTLSRGDQAAAEAAVTRGLSDLEAGWEKGRRRGRPLQAALVSLDPASGEVLAYVGGRDYGASQFDRAGQARRQAGSAFKPVVYAAALEGGQVTASTILEDEPLTVELAGRTWTPSNDDDAFRGRVSVRTALEDSLNVPTARLALAVGLERIVDLARAMGVEGRLEPYPSIALGAFEVTPVELATVYGTLAAGGVRPGVHGVAAVLDPAGQPLDADRPPARRRALSPAAAYLMTSLLQGVLDHGTGDDVRELGISDPLAGKTGTSNDRRDSWFAGYSPERVTLVWVGYDDNAATRLSGRRGALPIWSRFTAAVRPAAGFSSFRPPPGVVTALIDPQTGDLATDACPRILTEAYLEDRLPERVCRLHGGWFGRPLSPVEPRPGGGREEGRAGGWLRRLFGARSRAAERGEAPAPAAEPSPPGGAPPVP